MPASTTIPATSAPEVHGSPPDHVPQPPSIVPSRTRLIELLREKSFRTGEFTLASGEKSNIYIDCRTTTMHAEGLYQVGHLGWEMIDASGLNPDGVGGLTMGADPVAYAIAYTSWLGADPVHAFSVRKSPKDHGTGKRIEGSFREGSRVVVVEDVVTSGASVLEACDVVHAHGGEVLAVLSVVDREEGGRRAIESAGYRFLSLVSVTELMGDADSESEEIG